MKRSFASIVLTSLALAMLFSHGMALADEPVRMGVMRFLSRADGVSEQQAEAVGDVFARMLTSSQTISVIERDRLDAIAAEHELGTSGVLDVDTAVAVGRIVGCQYMLLGSVTNLAKKSTSTNLWLFGESKEEATVTIDARVVDVETTRVVLSLSETATSAQSGSNFNFYGVTTDKIELSGMEGRAIAAAASSLGFRIREALTGECVEVVGVDGKTVTFDAGAASGVAKGDLWRIYADGEEVRSASGRSLGRKAHVLAVVRVIDAQNDFSVAEVEKKSGDPGLIRRGDKVGPISPAEAADLAKRKAFAKERPKRRSGEAEILDVDERLREMGAVSRPEVAAIPDAPAPSPEPIAPNGPALPKGKDAVRGSAAEDEDKALDDRLRDLVGRRPSASDAPVPDELEEPMIASHESLVALPEPPAATRDERALERSSTDPKKVIASYGLPESETRRRIERHEEAGRMRSPERMIERYEEMARDDPQDYLAAYRAGEVSFGIGRKGRAKIWLDKALSINPRYYPAKALRRKLK